MPQSWDGKTERRHNTSDHDNITRLLTILDAHVKNFDKHVTDDEENFKEVGTKLWNHARFIYMGIGILAVLEFILKH